MGQGVVGMRTGRSTGKPTAEQVARFEAIHRIGCIACRKHCGMFTPAEVHHLTTGGLHGQRRRGHDFTIGLCEWHHRGVGVEAKIELWLGPSYARKPRSFREAFGRDDVLLAYQNELIEAPGDA